MKQQQILTKSSDSFTAVKKPKQTYAKTILNFGAGVNSTALAIEMVKRKIPIDYVIFADTGSELPETYEHLKVMREWFAKNNLKFIEVKSKYSKPLYDYYFDKRTMPFRMFRDCTDKFKRLPINNFVKQFKAEGVKQIIGIASDEGSRIRESKTKWITFEYPLFDWKIDRKKCIEIIVAEGLPVPVKSGCFMCPFQPLDAWENLFKTHPELYAKARTMEENNRTYPKNTLTWQYNLKELQHKMETQSHFTDLFACGGQCDGFCWV